jgi:[ribosomal protein S18]-alanine N-acetyltransferase
MPGPEHMLLAGVGRSTDLDALLAAGERAARVRDCIRIRLEVRADNQAAQALDGNAGYRRDGQRAGCFADGVDARLYGKPLDVPTG